MDSTSSDINREPENIGVKSTFVDSPENDIGSSMQFIGNFLEDPGDLNHIVQNKIWVTSDTHFHHRNILIYEATNRQFKDVDEMDRAMIERWNSVVRPCDVVLHLGDVAFAGKTITQNIVQKLNGRKWLLLGNHDRDKKFDWQEIGFERVFSSPFKMDGKFIFSHEPLAEIPDGMVNIYGHVHGSKHYNTMDSNRFCACVERHNLTPVEYFSIRNLYN